MSFCIGKDRQTNGAKILETNDRGASLELDKEGAKHFDPGVPFQKRTIFYI
ncbi:MAG: hypothetical protein ACLTNN_14410 [Blautia sp.]